MRKAFVSMPLKCTCACKHECCDFIEYEAIQLFFPKHSYKPGRNAWWNVNNKGFLVWEIEGLEKGWNTQEKLWINMLEWAVTIKHTHRECESVWWELICHKVKCTRWVTWNIFSYRIYNKISKICSVCNKIY